MEIDIIGFLAGGDSYGVWNLSAHTGYYSDWPAVSVAVGVLHAAPLRLR